MALTLPTATTLARIAPIAVLANDALIGALLAKKPTLAELFLSAPTPWALPQLAAWCGVSTVLFDRVVAGRQPLPQRLARQMAEAAGLQVGDVEAIVELTTNDSAAAYRPLPADRAHGEQLDFVPLAKTVEVYVV